jgi:hypothetical protein
LFQADVWFGPALQAKTLELAAQNKGRERGKPIRTVVPRSLDASDDEYDAVDAARDVLYDAVQADLGEERAASVGLRAASSLDSASKGQSTSSRTRFPTRNLRGARRAL